MREAAQHHQETPPAELQRAAKLAARKRTPVPVYEDCVRLVIRPDVKLAADAPAPEDPPAVVTVPNFPKRRRTGALTLNDPFWSIQGIAQETGTENVSGNVDKYLLEAYADDSI